MIQGSIVAIVTPMHPDGGIDLEAFDALVDWHIAEGTHAIVVVGTTGESATLTPSEHCDLVAHCVKKVAGRIPVIAGTGSNATSEALHFTREAKENGADACLLVTPYYNRPGQEGLYQHFRTIAEGVEIPQILYNVPSRCACNMLPDTVERLADVENIIGIKDASGDVEVGLELIRRCSDRIAVYSGEDAVALDLILAGARGTISVTANTAPALMSAMCAAALAGDEAEARKLNAKLALLHERLFIEANPIPAKWALAQMKRIGTGIRLPLTELAASNHVKVREALISAGVL